MNAELKGEGRSVLQDGRQAAVFESDHRYRTARLIFRGALAFNAALSVFWLVTFLGGGSWFFSDYRADWGTIPRVLGGVAFFYVAWGVIWWGIKTLLLRYFVGFTKEERRAAFSSRMDRPYDVAAMRYDIASA